MDWRCFLLLASLLAVASCGAPIAHRPPPEEPDIPAPSSSLESALERFSPIVLQEVATDATTAEWDRPVALDPDASGTLADDDRFRSVDAPTPFYAAARADSERMFLFYGLYYAVDWSGEGRTPKIDHPGDFEGALVIVSRARDAVEAVITQAHKRYYLWPAESGVSGAARRPSLVMEGDHPILFSESGGHGMYAWFRGRRWAPKGGRVYPDGPAAVSSGSLLRFVGSDLRPLSDAAIFVDERRRRFKDLPSGATPPWFWRGGGAPPGAIIRDPAALYRTMCKDLASPR